MDCNDLRAKLIDHLYGELSEEEDRALLSHQKECEDCRRRVEELKADLDLYRKEPRPQPPSGAIQAALKVAREEGMEAPPRPTGILSLERWKPILRHPAFASAAVLMIATIILVEDWESPQQYEERTLEGFAQARKQDPSERSTETEEIAPSSDFKRSGDFTPRPVLPTATPSKDMPTAPSVKAPAVKKIAAATKDKIATATSQPAPAPMQEPSPMPELGEMNKAAVVKKARKPLPESQDDDRAPKAQEAAAPPSVTATLKRDKADTPAAPSKPVAEAVKRTIARKRAAAPDTTPSLSSTLRTEQETAAAGTALQDEVLEDAVTATKAQPIVKGPTPKPLRPTPPAPAEQKTRERALEKAVVTLDVQPAKKLKELAEEKEVKEHLVAKAEVALEAADAEVAEQEEVAKPLTIQPDRGAEGVAGTKGKSTLPTHLCRIVERVKRGNRALTGNRIDLFSNRSYEWVRNEILASGRVQRQVYNGELPVPLFEQLSRTALGSLQFRPQNGIATYRFESKDKALAHPEGIEELNQFLGRRHLTPKGVKPVPAAPLEAAEEPKG
ncbi:MAG: anti-sigma factor [Planctomycetota bacterium]|jgi:anti-sigma factor RsiW